MIYKSFKSFKSLIQNTIGNNDSLYTVNKQTYIHSLYINTKIINKSTSFIINTITYQQINYMYIQQESVRCILGVS